MSEKIAQFRDPTAGALKAKMRGLDKILSNQDVEIARRQRQLEDQEQSLNRRFTALESTLGSLMTQQDFIKAKMGQG